MVRMLKNIFGLIVCFLGMHTLECKPSLKVYTTGSFAQGVGKSLKENFEKTHGVEVHYVTCQGTASVYLDLLNTKKPADGFIALSHDLFGNEAIDKVLAQHKVNCDAIDIPISWSNDKLVPIYYSALAFLKNSKKVPESITSFEELAQSKHKIIVMDPRTSNPGLGLILWIKGIYKEKAGDYWSRLKPKILTSTMSWSKAYALFMQGESPIVLSYITSPAYHRLRENNRDIECMRFNEGHILQVYVGGILQKSEQAQWMRLFLQEALSVSVQKKVVYEDWCYPVIDVKEPLPQEFERQDDLRLYFSPEKIDQNKKQWIDEWLDAMS